MSESHAAGWASDAPTPAQFKEFFAQVESRRITRGRLQAFLRGKPEPTPPQEEINSYLEMDPLDFFSEERFREAGITSPGVITRTRNAMENACKFDYSLPESSEIDIQKMRDFLLTYNKRRFFAWMPNVGNICIEAVERVIKRANLPFNWDNWD